MKLVVAGEGAFGRQHLAALADLDVDVVGLAGGDLEATRLCAGQFHIANFSLSLEDMIALPGVQAVILATPTPLHATQAIRCLTMGKHIQVEIPMADCLSDARRLVETANATGLVAAAGHTRRFNAPHRWMRDRLRSGDLRLQQLDVQTFFLRRTNTNALGEARTWTDNLLWHHGCHTVDLFQHQTGERALVARGVQGPVHADLGIVMDMSIQMKVASGSICTLSLSFNNQGPLGTTFRYICDQGTYIVRYDELADGDGRAIDTSSLPSPSNGVIAQDQDFIEAIREGREPVASVQSVLSAYETLDRIEASLI